MNLFLLRLLLSFVYLNILAQGFRGFPLPHLHLLKVKSQPKTSPLSTTSSLNHNMPLYFKTSDNDMFGRINTEQNIAQELDENENDDENYNDESIDNDRSAIIYDSKTMEILSKCIIPISSSLGFALAPSSKLAVRLASAAAGGIIGLGAKQSIRLFTKKSNIHNNDIDDSDCNGDGPSASASRALGQLRKEHPNFLGLSVKDIEHTAKRNRVHEKDLSLLFTTVFSEAVYDALVTGSMDLTELTDVMNFADSISLTPAEVGNGLAFTAIKLSNRLEQDERGFYTDEYPEEVLHQAAKLLFLSDKMIGIDEGYYGRRMIPALSFFTIESYVEVITKACKELFQHCIEDVLISPGNYQTGEVEELKQFLTVSTMISDFEPVVMEGMVAEAVKCMLDRTLPVDASPMHACVQNYDAFVQAQKVLGAAWSATTSSSTTADSTSTASTAATINAEAEWMAPLQSRTAPLFEAALRELFKTVTNHPERAVELSTVLQERVENLRIEPQPAQALIVDLVDDRNRDYMDRINKVYNVSGGAVEPAYKIMLSYAHTHAALKKLTAGVMKDRDLPLPGLPFPEVVRAHIYQVQLGRSSSNSSKKDGKHSSIQDINTEMFALTPEQQQVVRKHLALPKLTAWISQCLQDNNFSKEARAAFEKQLVVNNVTAEEWQATAIDFYHEEVKKIAQARAVPLLEEVDRLRKVQEFLNCSTELVDRVHLNLMGDKYVKALTECMAPTGVLTEEHREGLGRLSQRLGLTETHTGALFAVAIRARITPIIKDLVDIWKSDTDAYYRTEKAKEKEKEKYTKQKDHTKQSSINEDKFGFTKSEQNNILKKEKEQEGQDVFMREVMNLIEFITENHKALVKNTSTVDLSTLSITADGIVSPQDLAGLFKHYMIQKLSQQNPELMNRYHHTEVLFGRVLGIEVKDQLKIKESVLYTLYKRMLMNVLQQEDRVDTQIVGFFVQLRDALGVERTQGERIHTEATQAAMRTHTAMLFRESTQRDPLTPSTVRRLRSQVESLGLDWRADMGFSDALVSYLYALELQLTIETGATEELVDLQSAYSIPELRAGEILEATCKRHISQMLNLALRAAKKYDERDALNWLKRILLYVPYVSSAVKADGNLFSEADKDRLITFYQAEIETGDDAELVDLAGKIKGDVQDRLRGLINLSSDFVPPAQGMEGLLGQGQTLAQLEADLNVDQGRKAWAWG